MSFYRHPPEKPLNWRPFHECPSFGSCSVNCCPLDPDAERRPSRKDDPRTRCKAGRAAREEIAAKYGMAGGGTTHKERVRDIQSARGKARYDALPEETKMAMADRLKAINAKKRADTPPLKNPL